MTASCAQNFGNHFTTVHENLLRLAWDNKGDTTHKCWKTISNLNKWVTDQVWSKYLKKHDITDNDDDGSMTTDQLKGNMSLSEIKLRHSKRHPKVRVLNAKSLNIEVFNAITNAMANFITSSYIPINILSNPYFKQLLQVCIFFKIISYFCRFYYFIQNILLYLYK